MGLVAKAFQDIITFSRASSGTYVNSNGYITNSSVLNYLTYSNQPENALWTKSNSFVQQNVLTYSQDFDNVVWGPSGVSTPTANTTIAPDGTLTADTITATASTSQHLVAQTTAGLTATPITMSIYAKANTHNFLQIFHGALAVNYVNFNISTGVIGTVGAGFTSATIVPVGNGWFRCIVTFTPTATSAVRFALVTSNTAVYNESWAATGTESIFLWGAQVVQGSVPGDYRATTSAALPCLYADYNGALRARKLCEDAANAQHYMTQATNVVAGTVYTFSFRAKAGEKTQAAYTWSTASSAFASGTAAFNLATGVVTPSGAATGTMTLLGNGWYLCTSTNTCTATVAASANYVSFTGLTTYTGDGSSGIYIADAQLNDGASALAYYNTDANAYNAPRFDYDPVTLAAKGLLVEESRANLLYYSNDWSNVIWNKTNITRTAAAALGPDGTFSMTKLEATASTFTNCNQQITATATAHTYSIYAKKGSAATHANFFAIYNSTTATTLAQLSINYDTGVVTQTTGTGATATAAGNNIWRIVIPVTSGITVGNVLNCYSCYLGGTETAGEFAYVYGSQVEAGAFATSYIPTVASQVTRAADVASVNTLSPWFNSVASTVYIELQAMWTTGGTGSDRSAWSVSGGTSPLLGIVRASGGSIQFHDETTYRVMPNGVYNDASIRKVAIALADPALTANAAINGTNGTVTTDGSTLDAGTTAFNIGATSVPNGFWCGWIRRFTYYPRQMTLAECSTLTTL